VKHQERAEKTARRALDLLGFNRCSLLYIHLPAYELTQSKDAKQEQHDDHKSDKVNDAVHALVPFQTIHVRTVGIDTSSWA